MNSIRIKCPAKINLTLEVENQRDDGFHNIKSVMQLINLYDYLDISVEKSDSTLIELTGNNPELPYNEKNLVYKAADLFLKTTGFENYHIKINIEKNIPLSAGLAGGSTDSAGTILGLNILFGNILSKEKMNALCASLGSDLNVCLEGGCLLATGRGEKTEKLPFVSMPVTLIKPKNLGISAKEAYTKYSLKTNKPKYNKTEKIIEALKHGKEIKEFLYNDLEYAVFGDYKELQHIKSILPSSIMSGSGSTYFVLENSNQEFPQDYQVIKDLHFIPDGCSAE